MNAPELSAIIISYNGLNFLPDCLTTASQDLANIAHEIIVVDNGSTDGSVEFILKEYPDARCVRNAANLGFAKAVNIGIREATGRYLYILNQDLRFRPGGTRILLERVKAEPELGMVGPKFVNFDGTTQASARCLPTYKHVVYDALLLSRRCRRHREFSSWRMGWFDHESEMYVEQPLGSAMMIPREVVEKIGLFDERFPIFFNDVDFCRRLKDAGYRARYCPAAIVEHYRGGSTRFRPLAMKVESHRSMYRYLKKYAKWHDYPLLWMSGLLLLIGILPVSVAALFRSRST